MRREKRALVQTTICATQNKRECRLALALCFGKRSQETCPFRNSAAQHSATVPRRSRRAAVPRGERRQADRYGAAQGQKKNCAGEYSIEVLFLGRAHPYLIARREGKIGPALASKSRRKQ